MLNVKQGSCDYQLLKAFGLTRPGNQTQVYRLRGGRSKHQTTRDGYFQHSWKRQSSTGTNHQSTIAGTSLAAALYNSQGGKFHYYRGCGRSDGRVSPKLFRHFGPPLWKLVGNWSPYIINQQQNMLKLTKNYEV